MEACGNAFESTGDCAFNALGLVQKFALSAKCEANAHPKAKKSNAYFIIYGSVFLLFGRARLVQPRESVWSEF